MEDYAWHGLGSRRHGRNHTQPPPRIHHCDCQITW